MPVNKITPSSPAAFRLIMEGQEAFAQMERNGMKIDVPYLDRAINHTGKVINDIESQLKSSDVFLHWRKRYGEKANFSSRAQLGEILFNVMGYPCPKENRTKQGRPKTDAKTMETVDHPFVKDWNSLEVLKKSRSTFLVGLREEVDEAGFVHPMFGLHMATTYRSNCEGPNLQNQPIRDKRSAKLIRRAFVPRSEDHVLVEIDYGALEFRGAANFWHDPSMIKYADDSSLDIHRDMAMQCYSLAKEQVNKDTRGYAKNQFVFPVLYGSYYKSCAKNLWSQIGRGGLKTKDGVGIYEHLALKGIRDLEGFTQHIKTVEEWFNKKFPVWSSKKDEWWNQYVERGWFPLQTGFICKGIFSYNNLMNTPVQGPSFHLNLWSVTRINEWLMKNKMKSKVICQIHDSILGDIHRSELDDYLEYAERVMTKDVRVYWPWIKTTLAIEVDIAETNWFEKHPILVS